MIEIYKGVKKINSYVAKNIEPSVPVPTSKELFQSYEVNQVKMTDIKKWLTKGLMDLKNKPLASISYGLVFALVGIVLSFAAQANPVFVASSATGFLLAGPFLAIGLYDISRRIEKGKQPTSKHSITAINKNLIHISIYAIALGFVMTMWIRISTLVVGFSVNDAIVTDEGYLALFKSLMLMDNGFSLIFGLFFVGLIFAVIAFATGVATLPMLMDKKVDIVTACSTSIRAVLKNPVVMAAWAFAIAVTIGLGIATSYIGLVILMPLISYASWHAYRDLVVDKIDS